MAQRQPSSTGGMGDAVWGSADAERFSLGRVDPTLRRLRAPLSGATLKVRPQGGFGRYAPGGRRGCGLLGAGRRGCGCSGEAALHWPRSVAGGCSGEAALHWARVRLAIRYMGDLKRLVGMHPRCIRPVTRIAATRCARSRQAALAAHLEGRPGQERA